MILFSYVKKLFTKKPGSVEKLVFSKTPQFLEKYETPPPIPALPFIPKVIEEHILYIWSNYREDCVFKGSCAEITLKKYDSDISLEKQTYNLIRKHYFTFHNNGAYTKHIEDSDKKEIFIKNLELGFNTTIQFNNILYKVIYLSTEKYLKVKEGGRI